MGTVYTLKQDGSSEPMQSVMCKDEGKELQEILWKNFNLLPGDQIDPEEPCRWMLIRREMPVPDPSTGGARWSIDFFFADQNAIPTFVECKRYLDTRARREVIGQMFEYAANGQHYWSAEEMESHAAASAKEIGTSLDEALGKMKTEFDSSRAYFDEVERRLKTGEVRLVFFLEQAPTELKRLVEFLNRQMPSVEVLLVEARQYKTDGLKVVVPTLFGFTEQIREIKRSAANGRNGPPVATSWETFRANAVQKGLEATALAALEQLYELSKSLNADIAWGRGTITGSFSPKWPSLFSNIAPFSVYANGNLELHLGSFHTSDAEEGFAAQLAKGMTQSGFAFPDNYATTWFTYGLDDWLPKVDGFIAAFQDAFQCSIAHPSAALAVAAGS